jgi:hypothetical protein
MRPSFSFLLLTLLSCRTPPPLPDSTLQVLAARYVPGIRFGEQFSPATGVGYTLVLAPYEGWGDSTFAGQDGVRGMVVQMDEALADETSRPSSQARVRTITLGLPNESVRLRVQAAVVEVLGEPTLYCMAQPGHAKVQLYYWPSHTVGVTISAPAGIPSREGVASVQRTLRLGAESPLASGMTRPGRCHTDVS